MKYIKYNPSTQEEIDVAEMTTDEAVKRNELLRESGSDERWIVPTENDDDV